MPSPSIAPAGNWPLPEDRKAAVVLTDPARGILTEEQALEASRGGQSTTTKVDTPFKEDPFVGSLAASAEKETKADAKDFVPTTGDLDPKVDGEAAAQALAPYLKNNAPGADAGFVSAEEVQSGEAPSPAKLAAEAPTTVNGKTETKGQASKK